MRLTILVGMLLLVGAGALSAEGDDIARLMNEGRYDACLALIEQHQKDLPGDHRVSTWEIDFMGSEVDRALVGSTHFYFTYHTRHSNREAPGLTSTLNPVEPSRASHWRHVVVCVDARTGCILWSRPIDGWSRPAVDPATDTLYLIGTDAVVWLSADGGEPMMRPLREKEHVIGLLTKSGCVVSSPAGLRNDWNRDWVHLYATTTRSLMKVKLPDLVTLSPDESKRLVLSTSNYHGFENNIICKTLDGKHLWSFQVPGLRSPCTPRFYRGDVIWMSGTTIQKGQVVRLDGDTGKVVWRTVLPNGAYKPGDHQFKSGGYAWCNWDALRVLGDGSRLLAIDGTGRLFFLDGETGAVLRSVRPTEKHLCAPTVVGTSMVFCGFDKARAVPLATLMSPADERPDERHLLVLKARCLAALGRVDEALSALDHVLARDEDCAEAWRVRAEVCGLKGDTFDRLFSLCRYAQVAGLEELPELREAYGLLKLIPLGSRPSWQMADVGGREVYVGTQRGDLWAVWPETLQARVVETRDREIYGLSGDARLSFYAPIGGTVADGRVRPNPLEPTEAPTAWFSRRGSDGSPVFYRGRYFLPLGGGKVRIWDGKELVERAPAVEGIKEWKICVTPSGPLGYGAGGVYALDDDLCPARLVIGPPPARRKVDPLRVEALRSVGDSLGLVVWTPRGAYLLVYDRAGFALRSELYLGRRFSQRLEPEQFVVLGDGYVLSDRRVTWVSGRKDGHVWRFGPPVGRMETARRGGGWRYFGDPVIRDGKLLVSACDGMIYAFDTAHILTGSASRPRN